MASMEMESEYSMEMAVESTQAKKSIEISTNEGSSLLTSIQLALN